MQFTKRLFLISLISLASKRFQIIAETRTHFPGGMELLSNVNLHPVQNGAIAGPEVSAGSLWNEAPAVILVVRRPG